MIFVHALILMLGGHYTYARVPLGWLFFLVTCVSAQVLLARVHDRQLTRLAERPRATSE